LGLLQATSLNVANMVGIGPFITIPLFIQAMPGPQALVAWVIAAGLVLCDGLVWSELGAALPGSGGSYHFLSEIYGRHRFGRLIPFLFIWQFLVSGTLELASGYIGALQYLQYALPDLPERLARWHIPGGVNSIAALSALLVTIALCRPIRSIGWLSVALCAGTLVTISIVIAAGLTHFNPALLRPPADAWKIDTHWFGGLGAAMAIAIYDYLGYYNVCHLGDEVIEPGRTIPRAVMLSVGLIAVLYLTMNLSIIAVVPWQEVMKSPNIAADFMEILYGRPLRGGLHRPDSLDGDCLRFCDDARILADSLRRGESRWLLSGVRSRASGSPLSGRVVAVDRVDHRRLLLFPAGDRDPGRRLGQDRRRSSLGQIVGLHLLRTTRARCRAHPFRMWLYPLPSLIAFSGWMFLLVAARPIILCVALGVLISGCLAWFGWQGVTWFRVTPRTDREGWYESVISGQRRGFAAGTARCLLRISSWFYGLAVSLRNSRYDLGWKSVSQSPLPVISLGNLTTGGTGKTPLAAFVARWYRDHGVRVCFLSRGYGAREGNANDEALVLEQLCPDVPHLQNADRIASARIAHDELASQLLVLDDGFQHRRISRDLDLVLVDALNPWGYGALLPRGLLREPARSLRRASLIVLTRTDQAPAGQLETIRRQISETAPACDVIEVAFPPDRLLPSTGAAREIAALRGQPVAAFCGIGNPRAFRQSLIGAGFEVTDFRQFPDHHAYTRADIDSLRHWADFLPVAALVTTQKDLVKLPLDQLGERPLWALGIGVEIVRGAEVLERRLRQILDRIPAEPPADD
jgi:tetraacyldisaccharide 4'-kinase